MKALVALAALTSAVAAGLSFAATPAAEDIIVTRNATTLPSSCGPRQVAVLLERFFDAYNGRAWGAVDGMFAPAGREPADFKLFGFERDVVYERDRLLPYLASIRSRGERFRLVAISVGPEPPRSVAASYAYEQSAGVALGKVLIDCESQRIWQGALGAPGSSPPRLPCPRPLGWSPNGPVVACSRGTNAPTLADTFRVPPRSSELSGRCRPQAVSRRLTRMLTAFNTGEGETFARELARTATFQPRTRALRRSRAIAAYVSSRYDAGEGWTATRLARLRVAGARTARYRLSLDIVHQTELFGRGRVLVTLDCTSGLVSSWVGPGIRTPT